MKRLTKEEVWMFWHWGGINNQIKNRIWNDAGYSSSQSVTKHIDILVYDNNALISERLQIAIENNINEKEWEHLYKVANENFEKNRKNNIVEENFEVQSKQNFKDIMIANKKVIADENDKVYLEEILKELRILTTIVESKIVILSCINE